MITIDQVIVALADFLQILVPGSEIVRAQTNRVAMPPSPCIVLTELLQVDLETPSYTYDSISNLNISTPKRIDVQCDFYGDTSGDDCAKVKTVFRSFFATENFPVGIQPLYCGDGIQSPLITGEKQYESRWTLTVSLQYNTNIDLPQQYADILTVNPLIDVEVYYPII